MEKLRKYVVLVKFSYTCKMYTYRDRGYKALMAGSKGEGSYPCPSSQPRRLYMPPSPQFTAQQMPHVILTWQFKSQNPGLGKLSLVSLP